MHYAVTRQLSPTLAHCQLTHLDRQPIDLERARNQHAAYCHLLGRIGCTIIHLPESPQWPDSVFVEDTAVVTDELAIITRPGAPSRRDETAPMAQLLARFRPLVHIQPPATLDGGDVLIVGRRAWVGLTSRTNRAGFQSIQRILEPHDYTVTPVTLTGCLHLKSAATAIGHHTVIINPNWIDPATFADLNVLEVHPTEPAAANVLWLDDQAIASPTFPKTLQRIQNHHIPHQTLDASELAKAEGALTCCSILFQA